MSRRWAPISLSGPWWRLCVSLLLYVSESIRRNPLPSLLDPSLLTSDLNLHWLYLMLMVCINELYRWEPLQGEWEQITQGPSCCRSTSLMKQRSCRHSMLSRLAWCRWRSLPVSVYYFFFNTSSFSVTWTDDIRFLMPKRTSVLFFIFYFFQWFLSISDSIKIVLLIFLQNVFILFIFLNCSSKLWVSEIFSTKG